MTPIDAINEITTLFLIVIPIAGLLRIAYCVLASAAAEDSTTYRKRAFNALFFIVLAETALGLLQIFKGYF